MQGWGLDRCYRGPSGKAGPSAGGAAQPGLREASSGSCLRGEERGSEPPEAGLSEGQEERAGLAKGSCYLGMGPLASLPRPVRPEAARPLGS